LRHMLPRSNLPMPATFNRALLFHFPVLVNHFRAIHNNYNDYC
jgi:hypothetical protein